MSFSKITVSSINYTPTHLYKYYSDKVLKQNSHLEGKVDNGSSIKNSLIVNKQTKEVYITYRKFKEVLIKYSLKAGDKLVEGYNVDLLNGQGYLYIARIERNPNNLRLNRIESSRRKKELIEKNELTKDNWKIYYTDDEYIRVKWFKPSYTRNINFYIFQPAGGKVNSGFRSRMSRRINSNPALKSLYPFIPYIPIKKNGSL